MSAEAKKFGFKLVPIKQASWLWVIKVSWERERAGESIYPKPILWMIKKSVQLRLSN
jgi:hypothetical protein